MLAGKCNYPLSMDESINYALQHQPELEQAQAQVAIAEDQLKIAKGEKGPVSVL